MGRLSSMGNVSVQSLNCSLKKHTIAHKENRKGARLCDRMDPGSPIEVGH